MSSAIIKTPHAVSTKADGSMKKSDGSVDIESIKKFLVSKNLPAKVVCMEQIHSGDTVIVSDTSPDVIKTVDGLITNSKGVSLCVVTADCLPLLFYDQKKNVIAAVHAGNKGLLKDIIHNTLEILKAKFQSNPEDTFVSIGPAIERDCYEVGDDLVEKFKEKFSWFNADFFTPTQPGHAFLDLKKIALHCLLKEGILKEHIEVSDECTKCSIASLYSYRAGDTTGRFVSVISL